jgi:hypothetical protein
MRLAARSPRYHLRDAIHVVPLASPPRLKFRFRFNSRHIATGRRRGGFRGALRWRIKHLRYRFKSASAIREQRVAPAA